MGFGSNGSIVSFFVQLKKNNLTHLNKKERHTQNQKANAIYRDGIKLPNRKQSQFSAFNNFEIR